MTTGERPDRQRRFDHAAIEPKWQQAWDDQSVFRIPDDADDPTYVLAMFPYTSGELHMGHVRNYTITDAYARFERLRGEEVLHPMGWDSFGLPAENAAEERDTNPEEWTMECIETMTEQFERMGFGYDWEREITTCTPEYYRWNQWLFQQFHDAGLAELQAAEVNWCTDCQTVLADEQVEDDDVCWRCESTVEQRELDQWFLTITDYADELLQSLDELDAWPENVKEMQRNWIGRQEGTTVDFHVPDRGDVEIFTTRLDTIYGATFFVLSPGHELAQQFAEEDEDVAAYIDRVEDADEDEIDETSGVSTGEYAENPATGEEIPIYVADYVLEDVGTGALYAVPAHDERDHAFAKEHDIEIQQVVEPASDTETDAEDVDVEEEAYTEDGVIVNSGEYSGLRSDDARDRFVTVFDGEWHTEYRLRDWGISRQRYWGTPIPLIDCSECGFVHVPEDELPVELPEFVQTTGNPLDAAEEWKQVDCPDCGTAAERVTDTMDTFVDSSWYFLRFISPDVTDAPFDNDQASDWMPVDKYVGGIEHAVMHLLYARFFTKVLDDIDIYDGPREPFSDLTNQGMVLGSDGNKMSKSRGNGVSPVRIIEEYGADTARLFIMEAAQPERDFAWDPEGVESSHQFLQSVYELAADYAEGDVTTGESGSIAEYVDNEIDAAVATVSEEFVDFRFNHAMQATRELVSLLRRYREQTDPEPETFERGLETVTKLLSPVAPHVTEEIWSLLDHDGLVAEASWPGGDPPAHYEVERRLVEQTREDVRDIVEVAGIEDPERIDLAVAPEWKHRAYGIARDADGDVVGTIMQDETLREQGEAAADFAKELAGRAQLDDQLDPDRELAALERAAWLIEGEFGADVAIHTAEDADDDLAGDAEPGRPAIAIEE